MTAWPATVRGSGSADDVAPGAGRRPRPAAAELVTLRDGAIVEIGPGMHVDHWYRDAVVAREATGGRLIGVASFVRGASDPQSARLAIAVVGDWRRRGVGTALLARLTDRALAVQVFSFTAMVGIENTALIGLIRSAKAGVELVHVDADLLEYAIALTPFRRSLADGVPVGGRTHLC
jgi:GNAT superfamily N-acetyltransferase